MSDCPFADTPDVELYFYDELDASQAARVAAHLGTCAPCRGRLDDLNAIRRAVAAVPAVDAPPARDPSPGSGSPHATSSGDWSAFMRRLDTALRFQSVVRPRGVEASPPRRPRIGGHIAAYAAMLALVAGGWFIAARTRPSRHQPAAMASVQRPVTAQPAAAAAKTDLTPAAALREISAEHLERSKLVVLGLAARDPRKTRPSDWRFERKLAGTLLPDTRLYRLAAQESGEEDVAHVMRDLETVLLEASMTDKPDRDSLERVQRLIQRRGLVTKMQVMATSAGS